MSDLNNNKTFIPKARQIQLFQQGFEDALLGEERPVLSEEELVIYKEGALTAKESSLFNSKTK